MTRTRVQDPAVQALKLFGLSTAPGHAACIQEASGAPKEQDLWPLSCTCSPAPSRPSRQEMSSAGPAYPHTCSTGVFSSGQEEPNRFAFTWGCFNKSTPKVINLSSRKLEWFAL